MELCSLIVIVKCDVIWNLLLYNKSSNTKPCLDNSAFVVFPCICICCNKRKKMKMVKQTFLQSFSWDLPTYFCTLPCSYRLFIWLIKQMLKGREGVQVDIIDRLPTPFGLVRSGVAPDHPETKVSISFCCLIVKSKFSQFCMYQQLLAQLQ